MLLSAAAAGVLLWVAAQVGRGSTGGYWAAYGIVAGAGLVVALAQWRGAGNPPGMFLLGFLPVLIVAGWVLLAKQPHPNWFRTHVLAWSGDIGVRDVVHDVSTWLGVLAFGIGYAFGLMFEPATARYRVTRRVTTAPAPAGTTSAPPVRAPAAYDRRAAEEPTMAERREVPVTERGREPSVPR
jgi:hypothetical protein